MLQKYAPINELYQNQKFKKEISSLDEKVQELNRLKQMNTEKNAILSATINGQEEEKNMLFKRFQDTLDSVRESGYTLSVNGDGIIKATNPVSDKTRIIQGITNDHTMALKDIIDAERATFSKNESIIFGIGQSVSHIIREIAAYSNIFEVYKGNPERKIPVLWVAFPQGIYSTRGDLATVPEKISLSEIAGAYLGCGNFTSVIPKTGYLTYLVVNPSITAGSNISVFKVFREQTESIIREEYSKQGIRDKFFRQPFLWSMNERVDYFKKTQASNKR